MKLFGQIVRTIVNVVTLPVAVIKDVGTLGGTATGTHEPYTATALKQIKEDAKED